MKNSIRCNRLSFLGVAAAALTVASSASAHYYSLLLNAVVPAGDADQGAYTWLDTDVIFATPCTSQFVDHEMWYYMASGRWAEVGVSYGVNTNNGACEMSQVFWAQNNSNGYSEYWPGTTWSFDNWEYVYVERTTSTSCSWYVFFSANRIGTSTNNCAETGRALQAGIEATTTGNGSPGGYVRGWLENWERKDSSGTWHDGWDSPGIFQDNPPKMKWNNAGHTETQEVLNESYL